MRLTLATLFVLSWTLPVLADRAPPAPKPDAKPEEKAKGAPWTLKDVKEAWGEQGIRFKYAIETEDGAGSWAQFEYRTSEAGYAATETRMEKDAKEPVSRQQEMTWEEHYKRITDLVEKAKQSEEKIEVPLGKYNCRVYSEEVKDDEGVVRGTRKLWLTPNVPGTFVKAEMEMKLASGKRDYECWQLTLVDVPRLPLPWSAEQVRENWKNGATIVYKATKRGKAGTLTVTISDVSEKGLTVLEQWQFEGEKVNAAKPRAMNWDQFLSKAALMRHNGSHTEGKLDTALGEKEVLTHHQKGQNGPIKAEVQYHLDAKEPGLTLKQEVRTKVGDNITSESIEIKEYKKG